MVTFSKISVSLTQISLILHQVLTSFFFQEVEISDHSDLSIELKF